VLWKASIVVACAALAACTIAFPIAILPGIAAEWGFASSADPRTFVLGINLVVPGTPADSAGIRSGDRIDVGGIAPAQRYRAAFGPTRFDPPLSVSIARGNTERRVTLHARPWKAKQPFNVVLFYAGIVWMLTFAALIGVRCASDARARLLVLVLLAICTWVALAPNNFRTPWAALDAVANVAGTIAFSLSTLLAAFAATFATPISPMRRKLAYVAYGASVGACATGTFGVAGWWSATVDPFARPWNAIGTLLDVAVLLTPIVSVAAALRATRGEERSRLAWAALPLCTLFVEQSVAGVAAQAVPAVLRIVQACNNTLLFVVPIGLTYALFGRRILDIGFALNRAAVFAATSLIVAGSFAGLQWLASTVLTGIAGAHNLAASAAIAVVVNVVARVLRHRTDLIVTRTLFPKSERRLRSFVKLATALDHFEDEARLERSRRR
jgi:hypothetical protein